MEAVGIEAPFASLQELRNERCLLGRTSGAPGSIPTLWWVRPDAVTNPCCPSAEWWRRWESNPRPKNAF